MKTMKFPIDLSMLTEEEIDQFRQDPSTLFEGDTDVSLYLRFSSERQREQSIEGQLRDCRTFCKLNSYRITAIYVDRATTARKDVEKRVHFQEMIRDSEKKPWEYVVVWKLDRFARNRTDSALFKFRLRKNGVKVISATENISEKPEGIILEAVLEGMAEFYSADLSQKITRGMRESALKCHSIGGHVPLGYKIEDHKLVINPATAHIVREAFELYANGETVADICRMFNTKGYRTAKGVEFNRNSFKSMFRNKRYIGVYTYKDIEMEGGVPAIIDKELFETVSRRLSKNAEAPARGKAKVDYLLAGKLFCGHCGGSMNGESGTSRTGAVHNYYTCYTRKRKHACKKKPLKKEWIEYIVAQDAMELLTDDTIQELADMAISQTEKDLRENTRIPELTERMKETESGITNITNAIEKGIASDALMNRLVELEKEKKNLLRLLAEEEKYVCKIERNQIVYWLTEFKGGRIEDERYRRIIIDLMVNSVTVWDEPDGFRITTAYNLTSCKSKTFRIDPSSEKGFGFEGSKSTKSLAVILVKLRRAFCVDTLMFELDREVYCMKKVLSVSIKTIIFFVGWAICVSVIPIPDTASAVIWRFWAELIPLLSVIAITLIFWLADQKKIRLHLTGKPVYNIILGGVTGTIWLGASVGILSILGVVQIEGKNQIAMLWLWLLAAFLNTVMQEMLVRGYLYQMIKSNGSIAAAIIVSTGLFTFAHGGAFEAGILPVLNVITMSLFMTAVLEYTGSLIAPIVIHFLWNGVGAIILGGVSLAEDYPHLFDMTIHGNPILSGGSCKIEGSIIVLFMNLAFLIGFVAAKKRKDRNR